MAQRALVALHIPEILHSIITFSIGDIDDFGRSNRAYQLARVSRGFFQVAIPFAWEEVDVWSLMDLIPVVRKCFRGGSALTDTPTLKTKLELYDLETWTDAELSRLKFYGSFVKKLSYSSYYDYIGHELFETPVGSRILQYLATYVILPNLQELSAGFTDSDTSLMVDWRLCLVSASLRRFDTSRGQAEFPLVDAVVKRCPGLEILHLHGDFNHVDRPGSKTCTFSQLTPPLALRDLKFNERFICHDLLEWASKLPLLQRLKTLYGYGGSWTGLSPTIPVNPHLFKRLAVLDIRWDTGAVILLRACRFPNLTELSLDLRSLGLEFNCPDLHAFTLLATQYCPMITNLSFRVCMCHGREVGLVEWLCMLRPLRLSRLCIVMNDHGYEPELKELNERIAEYWPKLEHLSWDTSYMDPQMVANIMVLFPSLRSLSFYALDGPWIRPSVSVSSVSTQPLVLACGLPTRNRMKVDVLTRWLSYIRPRIRCDIHLTPSAPSSPPSPSPPPSPE